MSAPAGGRAHLRIGGALAATAAVGLYFFQSSTLGTNHTDEGLILGYIEAMARGEHPFFDFVDAYGILNWVFPVLFYKALGNHVWGVRVWMLVQKVVTVLLSYALVRNLARDPTPEGDARPRSPRGGRLYGGLAALFTTILLGAQWQSLQTAYAFLTVIPEVLLGWYFLLCAPFANPKRNAQAAGVLTAITIWTKLNTGMYLLAGGLFAYFFWVPASFEPDEKAEVEPPPLWLARLRGAGAVSYAALFLFFIHRYFDVWFFLFLAVPLGLGLTWSVWVTARKRGAAPNRHLVPFATYLSTTAALSLAVLALYYGKRAFEYVRELSGILSHIRYTAPFPPLGEPGHYIGLNEYYWLELPWLLTALFAGWVFLAAKSGPKAVGGGWPKRRAQVSALFVLCTLHSFVMYARADETHIYQALVLVVPVLFVVLAQLDQFLHAARPEGRLPLRLGIVGLCLLYACSLLVVPTRDVFAIGRSEWQNPKLVHLRYRREHSPYVREDSRDLSDHDWDRAEDEAAAYVKSVSVPGEEVLLLTANRLIHFNSDTRPVGGRYHFFFYLVSVGLLDREGFDALVPKAIVDDILERPPRVIVGALGWEPLAAAFPEFVWLRDSFYEKTHSYKHILIHELRMDGEPVQAPLR